MFFTVHNLTVSDIVITYYPQYCYPPPLTTALFPFYSFMLPLVHLDVLIPVIFTLWPHYSVQNMFTFLVYLYSFLITLDRLV